MKDVALSTITLTVLMLGSAYAQNAPVTGTSTFTKTGNSTTAGDAVVNMNYSGAGSGTNGPATAQFALNMTCGKTNFYTATGVGEEDCINVTGRQGGTGDMSGALFNLENTGGGFLNVIEATLGPVNTSTNTLPYTLNVQMGVMNPSGSFANNNFSETTYGFAANMTNGQGESAIYVGTTGSGTWKNFFEGSTAALGPTLTIDDLGNYISPTGTINVKAVLGDLTAAQVTVSGSARTLAQTFGNYLPLAAGAAMPLTGALYLETGHNSTPAVLPDPDGGSTTIGWNSNTHELAVTNNAGNANTFSVQNNSTSGFAALTARGADLAYNVGAAFEHAAFGWATRCNLRGGLGCDFVEASRYDGSSNAHELAPPFELLQTGGEFTAPPTTIIISTTAGSTTATVVQGTAPVSANAGQNITSEEFPNYIAEGAVISSVSGSTITMSKPAVITSGYLTVEYGPTAYGQYNWFEATETGPVNVYTFVNSLGGAMHDPFMVWDRVNGRVGLDSSNSPSSLLDAYTPVGAQGISSGIYDGGRQSYGYGSVAYNATVTPGVVATSADTILHTFLVGTNQANIWTYGGSGVTTRMVFGEVNSGTNPFEVYLDGSWQSRQVASPVTAQSASYTFTRSDCGTTIRDTGATAHNDTVPTGLPIGCSIYVIQAGAGTGIVKFVGAAGETIEQNGSGTLLHATTTQFAKATLMIDSSSTVLLGGNVQ